MHGGRARWGALIGTALRVAADGELLAKGPQVFSGYWKAPDATAEMFTDDGWFRTGDIGRIEDGFVRITGRKKELIVTAGGKNVAPTPIEDRLRAHSLISQAMVIGDNRPFISALVTIDDDAFALWRDENAPGTTVADHDDALTAAVQKCVDEANSAVSRAESIRQFSILPSDFSIADGEMTPTLKLRREAIAQRHERTIDEMYSRKIAEGAKR